MLIALFLLTALLGAGWLVTSHLDEYHRASWQPRALYSYLAYGFGLPTVCLLMVIFLELARSPSKGNWFALVSIGVGWVCVHVLAQHIAKNTLRSAHFKDEAPRALDTPRKHHGTQ